MNADASAPADEQFTSLLIACDEALAAGTPVELLTDGDTATELRPRLQRGLACLQLLGEFWSPRGTQCGTPARSGSRVAVATTPAPGATEPAKRLTQFGRFHILREIGRGSFGAVYLAHDPLLGRELALKIPRVPALLTPEMRQRFQHEAQAAARLDHPNLVPVYEAGTVDDVCFLTSPYCPGMTLAAWLGQRDDPVPWRVTAGLLATIADAVQHAHSRGVLHRDLKPANVLLESADRDPALTTDLFPRITDFGLAKLLFEGQPDQTGTGIILGSPSYMAPEQAQAKKEVTTAADVYGLGAILYEVLTGRPPFLADSVLATLEQVRAEPPVPPRQLQDGVPRDLETICLKCLHKDPRRRYASAHGLAEDLRRLLAGEPMHARPVGAGERLLKWAKRRPALAAVTGVICLAAGLLIALSVYHHFQLAAEKEVTEQAWQEAEQALQVAEQEKQVAEQQRQKTKDALDREEEKSAALQQALNRERQALDRERRTLYFHRVNLAHYEWLANNVARTEALLEACPRELRQWEWRYLRGLKDRGFLTFPGHTGKVMGVAFDGTGKRVASASSDGTIKVWDAASGLVLQTLKGHKGPLEGVAFSPDGQRVASASWDTTVKVWDVATGNIEHTLTGHRREVAAVAFSPDGKRLASASWDSTVKLWDAATGRYERTLTKHLGRVHSVAFSPDSRRLASGSGDGNSDVRLWDASSGDLLGICKADAADRLIWVGSVAFHRDGRRLASGNGDKTITIWDSITFKPLHVIRGHGGGVNSVRFSPDGSRLASASHDQTVRLWDTATGVEIAKLRGHTAPTVNSVDFAPDGQRLASGSHDMTVRVWDTLTAQDGLLVGEQRHWQVCPSADGRLIATAGAYRDGALAVVDAVTLKRTALPGKRSSIASVSFHPDNQHLASAGDIITIWDTKTKRAVGTLVHGQWINRIAYSPDGKRLASASRDKKVKIWDTATRQLVHPLEGHDGSVTSVAFSPDGLAVASASDDTTIRIWNAATGRVVHILRGHKHGVTSVAFDRTGKYLASGCRDATVKVWNLATGQEAFTLEGHTGGILEVAFSPDGLRLASGSADYTVKVWDVATGQEALTLRAHRGGVGSVAFSPDGNRLYGGVDGLKIWEAPPAVDR